MEILSVKNLNYKYEAGGFRLDNINCSFEKGEMSLVCGPSGCGKTTFLKMLKKEISPLSDSVYSSVNDNSAVVTDFDNSSEKDDSAIVTSCDSTKIGYLMQNPEAQIVCRTVIEELVFGAENLGLPVGEIRRLVAEISAYLGIEKLLELDCSVLSGGQKQLLNLASILMMKPEILLLDEPVSQLDPVSSYEFIRLVSKLKDEFGITIIVVEHNLEAFFEIADKVIYMEEGRICRSGSADEICNWLLENQKAFRASLPPTVKIARAVGIDCKEGYPFSVRKLVKSFEKQHVDVKDIATELEIMSKKEKDLKFKVNSEKESLAVIKGGWFRYSKNDKDVLKDISIDLKKGVVYGLIGGNGAGKSTLFSVLSGYKKLYRGKLKSGGKFGYLPQNPVYCFFEEELLKDYKMIADEEKINSIVEKYEFCKDIKNYFNMNPLDLSGGQQQKAAIFKMLLKDVDGYLLDEPAKGLDGYEKEKLIEMISELKQTGKTVVIISHDLEFIEAATEECLMMFEGDVIASDFTEVMFKGNNFYTTVRGRLR